MTDRPAFRPAPALDCVDAIDRASADIRAAADMLHALARHTRQPIAAHWLDHVAGVADAAAGDIAFNAELWHHMNTDPLATADHQAIGEHVGSIRRQASHLSGIAMSIDFDDGAPSRGTVADLAAGLLETAEALHQATQAAWATCCAQPEPAA